MKYAIFLDDTRDPPMPLGGFSRACDVVICLNIYDFNEVVEHLGCPSFISFDYDLGPEGTDTGLDCANLLATMVLDGELELPEDFDYDVHSASPDGRVKIEKFMQLFLGLYKVGKYGDIRKLINGDE